VSQPRQIPDGTEYVEWADGFGAVSARALPVKRMTKTRCVVAFGEHEIAFLRDAGRRVRVGTSTRLWTAKPCSAERCKELREAYRRVILVAGLRGAEDGWGRVPLDVLRRLHACVRKGATWEGK